jgi:hypothetical protein
MPNSCLNASICTGCNQGYSLSGQGTCLQCNVSECLNCNATNVCSSCADLFQLINGTCVSCNIQFCATCNASSTCSACIANYNLASNGTCVPFSCAIANCTLCNATNLCFTCVTQFSLFNNTCVSCNIPNCQVC